MQCPACVVVVVAKAVVLCLGCLAPGGDVQSWCCSPCTSIQLCVMMAGQSVPHDMISTAVLLLLRKLGRPSKAACAWRGLVAVGDT